MSLQCLKVLEEDLILVISLAIEVGEGPPLFSLDFILQLDGQEIMRVEVIDLILVVLLKEELQLLLLERCLVCVLGII